ncbi:CBS domain-containing protein [Rhizobiaceae sp. 2RAB30]
MKAKDVMTAKVVTVSPDHSIRHAAKIMMDNGVSGLPVVDDAQRLVGVISEGDMLRRTELGLGGMVATPGEEADREQKARSYVKAHSWRVSDVMTPDPVVVDEETSLARIAALMGEREIKRVPVLRNGALVGIVTRADLLYAIATAKLPDTTRGDEAIRRSILARFDENTGLKDLNISVTVAGGMVHLWGEVDTEECRQAARVVAEGVRGVEGVVEHFSDQGAT